jgi:hypothetical protein
MEIRMAETKTSRRLKTSGKHRSSTRGIEPAAELHEYPFVERGVTKTGDSKGRIALGSRFANRAVIVEALSETEVIVKLARVIPERESWLYENPQALSTVRKGLSQARAGQTSRGPSIQRDASLARQLEE